MTNSPMVSIMAVMIALVMGFLVGFTTQPKAEIVTKTVFIEPTADSCQSFIPAKTPIPTERKVQAKPKSDPEHGNIMNVFVKRERLINASGSVDVAYLLFEDGHTEEQRLWKMRMKRLAKRTGR